MIEIDITLTQQELYALGKQLAISFGELSPFKIVEEQGEIPVAPVSNPELVTPDGKLRAELYPCFQSLATSNMQTHLAYMGRLINLDMTLYYPSDSTTGRVVSLSAGDEGLRLQNPPPVNSVFTLLSEQIGTMVTQTSDIDLTLPRDDAWVFMGIFDAGRRWVLDRMLLGGESDTIALSFNQIVHAMGGDKSWMQWLAKFYADVFDLEVLNEIQVKSSLSSLQAAGLFSESGQRYLLTQTLQALVGSFLILDGHMLLRTSWVTKSGEIASYDVRMVQGLTGAFLSWVNNDQETYIKGISAAAVLELVSRFLHDPREFNPDIGKI